MGIRETQLKQQRYFKNRRHFLGFTRNVLFEKTQFQFLDLFLGYIIEIEFAGFRQTFEFEIPQLGLGFEIQFEGLRHQFFQINDIRANLFRSADQPDEWLRDVEVTANQTVEFEAIFQVGDVIVRVFDKQGREQTGDEYTVTIYPPGDRSRPVHRMQVGTRARIAAGPVELQVANTYSGASQWLEAEVLSGETTEIILDAPGSGEEPR